MTVSLLCNVNQARRQAIYFFTIPLFVFMALLFFLNIQRFILDRWTLLCCGPVFFFFLLITTIQYYRSGFIYKVSLWSTFLGVMVATGLYLTMFSHGVHIFGVYLIVLFLFHFSEFISVSLFNPATLSIDSFLLHIGSIYWVGIFAGWIEWGVEYYLLPEMKSCLWLSYTGLLICLGGELLRKTAMFTAKSNFNHKVQFVKQKDHQLVHHGVFSLFRHPSYVGLFYWGIGTQLILLNPICFVVYIIVLLKGFKRRIFLEEQALLSFFGHQYSKYQIEVGTGLPFLKGYVVKDNLT